MSERVLPASHPVLRHAMARRDVAEAMALHPISATEIARVSDCLDVLALQIALLPDQPLTESQKDRLRICARELNRRAQP